MIDLTGRVGSSIVVVASPALAAETIIASLLLPAPVPTAQLVLLDGWAAFTIGTTGSAARLRIRQTDVNGTVKADTGALTGGVAATNLLAQDVAGHDASPVTTYVLTLQVTAATAGSTVSAVRLAAIIF